MTAKQLLAQLKSERGFSPTANQLDRQLRKKWGLRKNFSKDQWQRMIPTSDEWNLDNNDRIVTVNDIQINRKRLRRAKKWASQQQQPPPIHPQDILPGCQDNTTSRSPAAELETKTNVASDTLFAQFDIIFESYMDNYCREGYFGAPSGARTTLAPVGAEGSRRGPLEPPSEWCHQSEATRGSLMSQGIQLASQQALVSGPYDDYMFNLQATNTLAEILDLSHDSRSEDYHKAISERLQESVVEQVEGDVLRHLHLFYNATSRVQRGAEKLSDWLWESNAFWLVETLVALRTPATDTFASVLLAGTLASGDFDYHFSSLLKQGADPDAYLFEDAAGSRPVSCLALAVSRPDEACVRLLLEHGAEVVRPELKGSSLYLRSALRKSPKIIQLLLDNGADGHMPMVPWYEQNGPGSTLMNLVIEQENLELLAVLLGKTFTLCHVPQHVPCPLQVAASTGNVHLVEMLLKAGAPVDGCISTDVRVSEMDAVVALNVYAILTPLAVALSEGNVAVAEVLLREGADVNGFGTAPLGKRRYHDRRLVYRRYSGGSRFTVEFGESFTAKEWQKWERAGYHYSDLLAASSPLQMAALSKSVQLGRILLKIGALSDGFGGFGTALQVASARMNNLSFVKLLLENGAKINTPAQEPRGRTALQAAVEFGSNDTVQFLLSAGANINALPSLCGFTALQAAVRTQDTELVVQLIGLGADVNAPAAAEDGRTALQAAVEGQNTDLIDALLDSGADISASPAQSGGLSALEASLSNHHVLEKLLSRGSASGLLQKLQTEGRALLSKIAKRHYHKLDGPTLQSLVTLLARYGIYGFQDLFRSAFDRSDMDMLSLLMTDGAAANVTNHELQVLLHLAVQDANIHFTKMLLDAGADVNILPSDPEGQPLIAVAAATGSQSLCELLIEHDADLKGYGGTKALCAAVSTGSMETLKFLLSEGASPNWGDQENQLHQNGYDFSPLAECFNYYTRETMAIVLLEHGAEVKGVVFRVEVCKTSMSMLTRLIGLGLDVNLRLSPVSESMLQYAVEDMCASGNRNRTDILTLLIDAGAKLHSLPGGGCWGSPLQIAVEHSNLCLVKYLLSKGADVNEPPTPSYGAPALQQAIIAGSLPIFCLLIDEGADVNAVVAPIGQTALESAAEHGRLDMAYILFKRDKEPETLRLRCQRAAKLAASRGFPVLARELRQWNPPDSSSI
ncbi:hypothetical protein V2A60_001301 [Cordyceps javanica]